MKNALKVVILSSLFCSTVAFAESLTAPVQGTLHVTVIDENGAVVPEAPVYIYGAKKSQFVGGADIPGSTTFTMKEGTYRISSALVRKSADVIDRFASNEAAVKVVAGDNVSVILTLKALATPEQQLPQSYAMLHIADVPGNQYHNN